MKQFLGWLATLLRSILPRLTPWQRRSIGIVFTILGSAMLLFALFTIADQYAHFLPALGPWDRWAFIPCVLLAITSLQTGRRFRARTTQELLLADSRPPVVYLRSFASDNSRTVSAPTIRFARFEGDETPPWLDDFTYKYAKYYAWASPRILANAFDSTTEEEQVAKAVRPYGPLVAIGRPNELLPTLGAARMYVGDQGWRERVTEILKGAALVMMQMGNTEGLAWEVSACIEHVEPRRLVLVVPRDQREVEAFAANNAAKFPHGLPLIERRDGLSVGNVRAIVYFLRDWTPKFAFNLCPPDPMRSYPIVQHLNELLEPVRVCNHVQARAPVSRRAMGVAFLVSGISLWGVWRMLTG